MSTTTTTTTYQSNPTSLVWGCGHTAAICLATDVVKAAEQIAAYTQIDCLPCAKAKTIPTRWITWADVNRSR